MRDKLIELLSSLTCWGNDCDERGCGECGKVCLPTDDIVILADHLLANGVVVPPCKAGDWIWEIEKECLKCKHFSDGGYSDFCECVLDDNKNMFECDFDKDCMYGIHCKVFNYSMIDKIGKTVFLTREEAEAKLKEGKG